MKIWIYSETDFIVVVYLCVYLYIYLFYCCGTWLIFVRRAPNICLIFARSRLSFVRLLLYAPRSRLSFGCCFVLSEFEVVSPSSTS